jgi:hypothetical protein
MTYVNCHFSRVRAGNQIRGTKQVEKFFVREPAAPSDDFVLHHCNVGRRTTKRYRAEFEEQPRQFTERSSLITV